MNTPKSAQQHERALKVLVGGVNSPVRSFKRVGGTPLHAKSALGAFLVDADDNRYVDFVMSYGPHLFGHAQKDIVSAVQGAAEKSSCYGMTTEGEIEWAELLLKRLPWAQKVRAMSTGTEACSSAIRLARGITGRDLLVKCAGHYHGSVDSLMVDAGSGIATLSTEANPDSAGIPKGLHTLSRVVEFNDQKQLKDLFAREGAQIAAFILEPVMGNMGVVPPNAEYLKLARELCTQHGTLLIFDEVMTGLRVHRSCSAGRFGVTPDLMTLGKIVGGGLPLAAVVGPSKYMDQLAPLGPVYQAGTLSGNPISIAAGIAMLNLIDREEPYAKLEAFGAQFETLLNACAVEKKIDLRVERVGSMISVYFRKDAVRNATDCRTADLERFKKFFWALLSEGIMIPPSPFEAWFLSTSHAEQPFDALASRVKKVFAQI